MSREDKEIVIALFNAHISTHTSESRPLRSTGSSKSEKLTRPKINHGMLEESWNSFKVLWQMYKTGAGFSESECSLQLIYCCEEELMEQVLRTSPLIMSTSENEQLEEITKLAVVPVAIGVSISEMLNMTQDNPTEKLA